VADRAVVFIDGNNWYHALRHVGVDDLGRLDYKKISEKLLGPRSWLGTRYYIGRMTQEISATLYAQQRHFLSSLENTDKRITVHLGRLEPRTVKNPAAKELRQYLGSLKQKIDPQVFSDLSDIAQRHTDASVPVEKAVDVMLAVDLVAMAIGGEYDAAYLLSADGDFTPAVEAARKLGKKVYAASPLSGARLASVVNTFIPIPKAWLGDCYS